MSARGGSKDCTFLDSYFPHLLLFCRLALVAFFLTPLYACPKTLPHTHPPTLIILPLAQTSVFSDHSSTPDAQREHQADLGRGVPGLILHSVNQSKCCFVMCAFVFHGSTDIYYCKRSHHLFKCLWITDSFTNFDRPATQVRNQ